MAKAKEAPFVRTMQAIADREQMKKKTSIHTLESRLRVAKDSLKDAVDRWDRDSILLNIDELEWTVADARREQKEYGYGGKPMDAVEAQKAVFDYNEDVKEQSKQLQQLDKQLQSLMTEYVKKAQPIIMEMIQIEQKAQQASRLQYHLPNGVGAKLERLHQPIQLPASARAVQMLKIKGGIQ
ncbi:hypothetical protein CSV77_03610 [Sporosarcina sp. P16b]|uniref:hypothetical protein n=1 Tax=Sporosarcina sp. P16b TaxID=2048261 RepID=UPI000C165497|nr:hypothetical protein [Sporosarcina sp. P16b]PIC71138.1 hypothetical protein CSV77_03610 [Sporosarcina sp. P16b]